MCFSIFIAKLNMFDILKQIQWFLLKNIPADVLPNLVFNEFLIPAEDQAGWP